MPNFAKLAKLLGGIAKPQNVERVVSHLDDAAALAKKAEEIPQLQKMMQPVAPLKEVSEELPAVLSKTPTAPIKEMPEELPYWSKEARMAQQRKNRELDFAQNREQNIREKNMEGVRRFLETQRRLRGE